MEDTTSSKQASIELVNAETGEVLTVSPPAQDWGQLVASLEAVTGTSGTGVWRVLAEGNQRVVTSESWQGAADARRYFVYDSPNWASRSETEGASDQQAAERFANRIAAARLFMAACVEAHRHLQRLSEQAVRSLEQTTAAMARISEGPSHSPELPPPVRVLQGRLLGDLEKRLPTLQFASTAIHHECAEFGQRLEAEAQRADFATDAAVQRALRARKRLHKAIVQAAAGLGAVAEEGRRGGVVAARYDSTWPDVVASSEPLVAMAVQQSAAAETARTVCGALNVVVCQPAASALPMAVTRLLDGTEQQPIVPAPPRLSLGPVSGDAAHEAAQQCLLEVVKVLAARCGRRLFTEDDEAAMADVVAQRDALRGAVRALQGSPQSPPRSAGSGSNIIGAVLTFWRNSAGKFCGIHDNCELQIEDEDTALAFEKVIARAIASGRGGEDLQVVRARVLCVLGRTANGAMSVIASADC